MKMIVFNGNPVRRVSPLAISDYTESSFGRGQTTEVTLVTGAKLLYLGSPEQLDKAIEDATR